MIIRYGLANYHKCLVGIVDPASSNFYSYIYSQNHEVLNLFETFLVFLHQKWFFPAWSADFMFIFLVSVNTLQTNHFYYQPKKHFTDWGTTLYNHVFHNTRFTYSWTIVTTIVHVHEASHSRFHSFSNSKKLCTRTFDNERTFRHLCKWNGAYLSQVILFCFKRLRTAGYNRLCCWK